MNHCATLLLVLAALAGCDQEAKAPSAQAASAASPASLKATAPAASPGADWSDFVPDGWQLDASARGSLSDAEDDAVLVLRGADPAKVKKNEGLGEPELDLNPRKLVFLQKTGGEWRKTGETSRLLPSAGSAETPCLVDPLAEGGIAIKDKVLSITLHYWLSCGSYGVTNDVWKFRSESGRFRLIGKEHVEFSRSTHDERTTSRNFLTGREVVTSRTGEEGDVSEEQRKLRTDVFYIDDLDPDRCEAAGENTPDYC